MAHILIAEDDEAVRSFVARALQHHGHTTHTVADGGAAVRALQTAKFDLLLTDIVMPVMDGVALALKASADYPHLPIVMMTGYASEYKRAHNLESLIHDVINKPFSLTDICTAVDQALDHRP
ncbi:MAG: response regulator [Kordiimonas sp.]|nr:response regulator [Kordiimonas sp.]